MNIKKIIQQRALWIFMGLIAITSCENFTEFERPFILVEGEVIQDIDDVERLLAGAYDNLTYTVIFERNSLASDEVRVGGGNRGQGLQEHDFVITAGDDGPTDLWAQSYNSIDNFNRVIEFLDLIVIDEGDLERANSLRGQALAVRAMLHFDLLRAFAPDLEPNSPGVILQLRTLDFATDSQIELPRVNVGEVLDAIQQDLDLAETLIPASLNSDYEFFNLNAVSALKARIALYTGNYQEAIDQTTEVIAAVPPLASTDDYFNMWRNNVGPGEGPSETIFQIERDITDGRIGTIWQSTNLDVFFSMSTDLFNQLSPNDIRFDLLVDNETEVTEDVATEDEIIIGKYLGASNATRFLNHVRVFRSSEMLLIRAEANARLMNLSAAQQDIELLRDYRGGAIVTPDYSAIGMEEALLDILDERRIELAYEGHRFFDLKRFGLAIERPQADCNINCELPADSFRFTYPIPQAEIFANDSINEEDQNAGYN
jgi:hypothetical protein